ncbi:hypothetical protein FRX31_026659 [Thalictrum thalictroides]|uniref:Uncharacterized protein n=1 Tax=Thalictrum thalictroides TaxID=46969 RepID=A0A7J6VF77_THATH|nr:hypothetical protein FRX31_026659 [Thalictrum thalictroides]
MFVSLLSRNSQAGSCFGPLENGWYRKISSEKSGDGVFTFQPHAQQHGGGEYQDQVRAWKRIKVFPVEYHIAIVIDNFHHLKFFLRLRIFLNCGTHRRRYDVNIHNCAQESCRVAQLCKSHSVEGHHFDRDSHVKEHAENNIGIAILYIQGQGYKLII